MPRPNNYKKREKWHPEYATKGYMQFEVSGIVQKKTDDEKNMCEYVEFYIDTPGVDGNISTISLTNYYDNDELREGDRVTLKGNIRSLWNKDIKRITYWFEITEVIW